MTDSSVKPIRSRLLRLLFISYAIVILLSILIMMSAISAAIINSVNKNPLENMPMIARLEGYYAGNHQSWDGVEGLIARQRTSDTYHAFWKLTYLLDPEDNVLLNIHQDAATPVGSKYLLRKGDLPVTLVGNGAIIGRVVFRAESLTVRLQVLSAILIPIGIIALTMAAFMIISDYLLVRRIVNPLSNTIAVAKQVTAGNLKARVDLSGPDDMVVLNKTFNQMIETLDESNTKRQEFLADIAHELRTPLTIMHGRLEGILDHVYPADESQIASILQETYLMERLVDDLRTLTLAETRQLRFDPKKMNLPEAIQKIQRVFTPLAEAQNITIELDFTDPSLEVCTDPQRFEQVMGNIINNSIKYIKSDGKIQISASRDKDNAILTISDDGPGIRDEDLPFIFDRFWRKEKSRSRNTGGSGLGLAIARQLIEAQGGTITAGHAEIGGLKIMISLSTPAVE
jgi:signal transduction histidine kinase